ncbi:MAG: YigZ family protein [Bacteroidota bacterium]|nr:YigZ family protein [Bacteroidota bacterium]
MMEGNARNTGGESAIGDRYRTIRGDGEFEFVEKRSRFLAIARPVESSEAAADFLGSLRKRYHSAAHHCSAWRIGYDGETTRFSDDGEPAGTAGRRILDVLVRRGVTNAVIVVVRWFGGIKLGTSGLAHAYSRAAEGAVERAGIVECVIFERIRIGFPYERMREVHAVLEALGAEIVTRSYVDTPWYVVRLRRSKVADLRELLHDMTRGRVTIDSEDNGT